MPLTIQICPKQFMPSSKNSRSKSKQSRKVEGGATRRSSTEPDGKNVPVVAKGLRRHWPLGLVWIVSLIYLWNKSDGGWIPHDEGLLAQTAERVLGGQLPHRDFDDPYTGGLAMLHALSFALLGVDLYSMRLMLMGFSLASIPAIYAMSLRTASPVIAAVVALASVVWSIPNYFGSLPSWYNLFFAIFGTWSMIKFIETDRPRWLVLAGAMGGFSILIKVTGLFFVAAGFLFLLFREQEQAKRDSLSNSGRDWLFPTAICSAAALVVAAVVVLIRQRWSTMDLVLFVLPTLLLASAVWSNELRMAGTSGRQRWLRLIASYAQFASGVALPLIGFAIPYIITASLDSLLYGNFVLPQRRMQFASSALPLPATLVWLVPIALCFLPLPRAAQRLDSWQLALVLALPCALAVLLGGTLEGYGSFWSTLRPLVPLVTLIGVWRIIRRDAPPDVGDQSHESDRSREILFWILAATAMVSLVQYPFSAGIYFCYVAPMVVVAGLFAAKSVSMSPRYFQLCLLLTYVAFGVVWLNRNYIQAFGNLPVIMDTDEPLRIERANLRVAAFDAPVYQGIVRRVQLQSEQGQPIYASADCPEIYFLCNRRNPTRTIYDFFDADFQSDPRGRAERLLAIIDREQIKVVVMRWRAEFSGPPPPLLVQGLKLRFPQAEHYSFFPNDPNQNQPDFSVMWRD